MRRAGAATSPAARMAPARLCAWIALASLPAGAAAQGPDLRDSAGALEAARDAQARFETQRRNRLPLTLGGSGGPCAEVVGRFCWRPDDVDRPPPPEPEEIGTARLGLLIELAGLSQRIPGDRWLLGQQVRYRIEGLQTETARRRVMRDGSGGSPPAEADSAAAEHFFAAATLAGACPDAAPAGWCTSLRGLVLHAGGRYGEAERAFRAADAEEGAEAHAGRDLRDILDADARALLREAADTAAFLRTLWLLADPLWGLPGNDRWTEHESRRAMVRLQEDARNAFGIPWGDDLRELHVRFGWEVGWERTRRGSGVMAASETAVIGYQQDHGYGFLPPGSLLADPLGADDADRAPDPRPRREGYAPAYLDTLIEAEHQVAAFRRGDSLLVLTAHRGPARASRGEVAALPPARAVGPDRAGPLAGPEAYDAVVYVPWDGAGGPGAPVRVGPGPAPPGVASVAGAGTGYAGDDLARGTVVRTRASLPPGAYLVSLESLDPGRAAARARTAFRREALPDGVAGISDLLLFAPDDAAARPAERLESPVVQPDTQAGPTGPAPTSSAAFDAALERMLPSSTVAPGASIGVAWELYGLRAGGEAVEFDVSLRRGGESFLHRAGRWLGLVGGGTDVSVRWTDPALPAQGVYARTLTVATPPGLDEGRHTLRLVARTAGRTDLVAEREVLVAERGR